MAELDKLSLNIDVKDNASYKLASITQKINNLKDGTQSVSTTTKLVGQTGTKTYKEVDGQIKSVTTSIKEQSKGLRGLYSSYIKFAAAVMIIKRVANFLSSVANESSKWIENLNLFEVAFNDVGQSATDWAINFTKSLSLSYNEVVRYMGLFKQMAESIGVTEEAATSVSKALTQMTYDLASLYNIQTDVMAEKLRAGLAGQTKPLRQIGMDITAVSIDQLLQEELGLDMTSKMLTQADKQLARTILIIMQGKAAIGDFAATMNTFSNQQKIFAASMSNFKLALGDFILEPAKNILTYLNAILIAITNIIRAFVPLTTNTGRDVVDFGDFLGDANDELEDMEQNLNLLSFDKFNVMDTGTSGGLNGGVSDTLLDTFNKVYEEYMVRFNAGLESINNTAKNIANNIVKWVFPLSIIDEETGNIQINTSKLNDALILIGIALTAIVATNILNGIIIMATTFGAMSLSLFPIVAGLVAIVTLITQWSSLSTPMKALLVVISAIGIALAVAAIGAITLASALTFGVAVATIGVAVAIATKQMGDATTQAKSQIPQYANGGFPDSGQIFMARENGLPEMVGSVGGRTAVANNDQIVEAVSKGVAQAVSSVLGSNNGQMKILVEAGDGTALSRALASSMRVENQRRGY